MTDARRVYSDAMDDPIVLAGLVLGTAGLLLGLWEFRRRERLLARLRPWERFARTIAAMGREHLRNADHHRARLDEAHRTIEEMTAAAKGLADEMQSAGVRLRGDSAEEPRG